jgi:hypothetical protein
VEVIIGDTGVDLRKAFIHAEAVLSGSASTISNP